MLPCTCVIPISATDLHCIVAITPVLPCTCVIAISATVLHCIVAFTPVLPCTCVIPISATALHCIVATCVTVLVCYRYLRHCFTLYCCHHTCVTVHVCYRYLRHCFTLYCCLRAPVLPCTCAIAISATVLHCIVAFAHLCYRVRVLSLSPPVITNWDVRLKWPFHLPERFDVRYLSAIQDWGLEGPYIHAYPLIASPTSYAFSYH